MMKLLDSDDKRLHTVCEPVPHNADLSSVITQMREVMDSDHKGMISVGMAGPQVGVMKRIIIVKYASVDMTIYNPVITDSPGKVVNNIESCLSFPGKQVKVKRSKRVIVEGFDENWDPVKIDARNLLACIFQHEIDHLNGKTIV
jgi:peptide deformylase